MDINKLIVCALILLALIIVVIIVVLTNHDKKENLANTQENITHHNTEQLNTKQIYNKYEEITKPSSIHPYISRDQICYRYMLPNTDFVQDRPYCMACQVDKTDNGKNRSGTQTNVISTCVYADEKTKQECIDMCKSLNDN